MRPQLRTVHPKTLCVGLKPASDSVSAAVSRKPPSAPSSRHGTAHGTTPPLSAATRPPSTVKIRSAPPGSFRTLKSRCVFCLGTLCAGIPTSDESTGSGANPRWITSAIGPLTTQWHLPRAHLMADDRAGRVAGAAYRSCRLLEHCNGGERRYRYIRGINASECLLFSAMATGTEAPFLHLPARKG